MITETKYKDYLPLYLKRGVKVNEWLGFLTDLIINYESSLDGIFEILTFQTGVNFDFDGNIVGAKADSYRIALLKVASWFGITQIFTCNIKSTGGALVLKLSDREIFRLLRTQLWKIGFDGTTESLETNIKKAFVVSEGLTDLEILIYNGEDPASARIVCLYKPGTFSTNDALLWDNGYYNNPVLGIHYIYQSISNNQLMYDFNIPYDGGWFNFDDVSIVNEAPTVDLEIGDMWVTTDGINYTLHIYQEGGSVSEVVSIWNGTTTTPENKIIVGTKMYNPSTQVLSVWRPRYIYDGGENQNNSEVE